MIRYCTELQSVQYLNPHAVSVQEEEHMKKESMEVVGRIVKRERELFGIRVIKKDNTSKVRQMYPEDKASFVEKEKAAGRKVIMIGDGINDSPALSAADVGIAISDGAEIAREIADITVGADDLGQIVTLRRLSNRLMKRIQSNYRFIAR